MERKLSIEVNSYSNNWKKENQDLVFYQRKYIKNGIILLSIVFVIFLYLALILKLPLQLGIAIIFMIIYLLLRGSEKYIILGQTYITVGKNSKLRIIDLLFFTLFFIVYALMRNNESNKMNCILLKNIESIIEENNFLRIDYKQNTSHKQILIDLNYMTDDDKQSLLKEINNIKQLNSNIK